MPLRQRLRKTLVGRQILVGRLPTGPASADAPRGPDWSQAAPEWIDAALAHALEKPGGGWYVLGPREDFASAPKKVVVLGQELVVWRGASGELLAAPDACPHLGASLSEGRVEEGRVVCPWHGLRLDARGFRGWRCHAAHDDGVLAWVQLGDEAPTEAPILAPRPSSFIAGTIKALARCEPEDVLANRLDPWHGAHFHPHSFSALEVLERDLDQIRLRVVYRILGPVGIEVDATFHCPDRRTIVMTIVDGDGAGSVVETHATPIRPGETLLVESTLATSERPGFGLAKAFGKAVRPFIEARAQRLWVEDVAYAERRYALRMAAG
ncbi:MAG: Rieske 2Fe-2S domain-containing protein [Deltaproteobacteria bacterium]|nr:Rieske 2Fe-2S domain-containing protein [Deltaproteobacteria bacterium]